MKRTLFLAQERTGSTLVSCCLLGQAGNFQNNDKHTIHVNKISFPIWLHTIPRNQCMYYHIWDHGKGDILVDGIMKRPIVDIDEAYMYTPAAIIDPEWWNTFPQNDKWKFIYLLRDPRNRVTSICKRAKVKGDLYEKMFQIYTNHAKDELNSVKAIMNDPRFYLLRFEDLIQNPITKITDVFKFMGYEIDQNFYQRIIDKYIFECLNSSYTDNGKGSNQRWSTWNHKQKSYFKTMVGQELIDLNYERNNNW